MIEKVNPAHPDKIADRIAGAIVDLAYKKNSNPKVAVEVLIGHGVCHVIIETSETFTIDDEDLLVAIASSAGISLENAQLFERQSKMIEEQKIIFDSFIETLASSIDARDKITSGHSTRVKMYSTLIAHEFGMEKNDISILEKEGVEAKNAYVVGDSIANDLTPAKEIGINTIHVESSVDIPMLLDKVLKSTK